MSTTDNSGETDRSSSYRNTPEGRETARLYADIIHLSRPASAHPRMDPVQRAKIFAPYDALRGFDEAIDSVNEEFAEVPREELSEEEKEALSDRLQQLRKGMRVRIRYFAAKQHFTDISAGAEQGQSGHASSDGTEESGQYILTEGIVIRIDAVSHTLSVREETQAPGSSRHPVEKDPNGLSSTGHGSKSRVEYGRMEKDLPTVIRFEDIMTIEFPAQNA